MDVLIEDGQTLLPLEIKFGETVNASFFDGLERWLALPGTRTGRACLIYGGDRAQTRQAIKVLPWRQLRGPITT